MPAGPDKISKGFLVPGFCSGLLSLFTHGIPGSLIGIILCGYLFKGCFNLHCTSRALWNGRLLAETGYVPVDRAHPVAWFVPLGLATFALSRLPLKTAGLIVDVVVVSGIAFFAAHLIGRTIDLSRFKRVRTACLRHQYGV